MAVACALAFKRGSYGEAVRLMRRLEHPEHVAIVFRFRLTNIMTIWSAPATVSLLHLAAYHGWLDIVMNHKLKVLYECRASNDWTPLYYAAVGGSLPVVQYLITVGHCNPAALGPNNFTLSLLGCACIGGHMNIVDFLITELHCDPTNHGNYGFIPLHIACFFGHLNVTKYFITEHNCDPNSLEKGWTPLHRASEGGQMNIVEYLITELHCDPTIICNNDGRLPLHIACRHGHLNLTKYFTTEQNCDPTSQDLSLKDWTPLHHASKGCHMNIVEYLITELHCDPTIICNNDGRLPLHIACRHGHLNLTKYFTTEQNCDPTSQDLKGWTPLHHASKGGHMNIVEYLITELHCDPTVCNNVGSLPLHVACCYGHLDLAKYFIVEQKCDPTSLNDLEMTALHYACERGHKQIVQCIIANRNYDNLFDSVTRSSFYLTKGVNFESGQTSSISQLFSASEFSVKELFYTHTEVMKEFPIHSYNKVILTGNSAAGKTTLTAVIAERAAAYFSWLKYGNVPPVELNTAGIFPSHVKSCELGNLVLYDLAGHAEYQSSHYAVMETVMKQSPAIFINVVDLSKPDTEITKQLAYWLDFIDNATSGKSTKLKSCLIIIGSHADLLNDELLEKRSKLVNQLVKKCVNQEFLGFVSMDCRKIDCRDTRKFTKLLSKSQQAISAKEPPMSFTCHFLYAVLQWRWKYAGTIAWKLQDFSTFLNEHHSSCIIPSEIPLLNDLLLSLSSTGVIMYLQNHKELAERWIVVDTKALLNKIIAKLSISSEIASDAGIVLSSSLQQLFPDYDLEMLVGLLEALELCHHVNLSSTSTNLTTRETHTSGDTEGYLFFPSLLSATSTLESKSETTRTTTNAAETTSEGEFSFGWCLSLMKNEDYHDQFFTSRFLHVLLLRLAYTFPLASAQHVRPAKRCSVWENGISWDNAEGITTIVKLIEHNQCVVVVMSHRAETRQLKYLKHRSSVIKLVLDLQQELGPHLHTCEYLVDQPLLKRWPWLTDDLSNGNLLPIVNVCSSMLLHKPYILTDTGKCAKLSTVQILKFEPYYRLRPSSVCELMDSMINCNTDADKPISPVLLYEMRTCFKQSLQLKTHNYLSMRECLDKMSLFAGRNPIVSTVCK